ncbi:MAG: hypothetical protein HFI93_02175 [Lachnospiraceae bacterium]|nr:hypothetical protein [Lachnospiraceae bacterium]
MRKKQITFRERLEDFRQKALESLPIRVFLYKFIKTFHNAWGRRHVRQVLRYSEMFILGVVASLVGSECYHLWNRRRKRLS